MESEKAFDMLPVVSRMYKKLDIKQIQNKLNKEKDVQKVGMEVLAHIFENSAKVKTEFFELVSIYSGKTIEEAKAQPFPETIKVIKEIFTDAGLKDFFE